MEKCNCVLTSFRPGSALDVHHFDDIAAYLVPSVILRGYPLEEYITTPHLRGD